MLMSIDKAAAEPRYAQATKTMIILLNIFKTLIIDIRRFCLFNIL